MDEVDQCDFLPQIIDMVMGIFFPSKTLLNLNSQ